MAYRFNPPPNWPINEPGWTPPAGWQPDPEWGPAPEGWDFWVDDEVQSAETQVTPTPGSSPAHADEGQDASPLAPEANAPAPASPYSSDDYGYGNTGDNAVESAPGHSAGNEQTFAPEHSAPEYEKMTSAPSAPSWQSADNSVPAASDSGDKGFLARFWWIGCIIFIILGLIIAAIALIASMLFGNDGEPGASGSETPSATATSNAPKPSPSQSTTPAASQPTPSASSASSSASQGNATNVLPGPTPGANAETKEVTTFEGKGKLTMSTQWVSNDEIKKYGEHITPSKSGQYLMVVAKLEVTEGQVFFNPLEPVVTTPYGGTLDYSTDTYSLTNSGHETSISDVPAGTTASMAVIYDVKKVDGLTLTWSGDETGQSWKIPAK